MALGSHISWGEAPKQLYLIDEGAGLLSPKIVLRQYARRALIVRYVEAGCLARSMGFTNVSSFVSRLGSCRSLALPKVTRSAIAPDEHKASPGCHFPIRERASGQFHDACPT
jgi:hypothetical protein